MPSSTRTLRLVVVTTGLQSLALAATAGALSASLSAALEARRPTPDAVVPVGSCLEALAWLGLALCGAWFAAAVLACAHDLARHPARPLPRAARSCLRPPVVRALLVVLVGGCLATPTPRPVADHGHGWSVLDGLPLPGLPLGAAPRPDRPRPARVVVRPGDSLWSISAHILGPHASDAEVARTWPRLHAANRALIGNDPDLVLAGSTLRVPAGLARPTQPRPGAAR